MVIEMLTFQVSPEEQDEWLQVEETVWTRFLELQDGFVRKEMWRSTDRNDLLHAVIWWASRDQWKAITADEVAAVDARMGSWFRPGVLTEYALLSRA